MKPTYSKINFRWIEADEIAVRMRYIDEVTRVICFLSALATKKHAKKATRTRAVVVEDTP